MKYIDAEKLKAAIEKGTPDSLLLVVYRDIILSLIDSLQQEQQEEPDKSLEEAADKHIRKVADAAGHPGWEWQKGQMMDEWLKDRDGCFWDGVEEGKKAMEQQMLKEAVEGEIQMRYSGCLCAKTIRAINEDKFKLGDKVRIIIVKED